MGVAAAFAKPVAPLEDVTIGGSAVPYLDVESLEKQLAAFEKKVASGQEILDKSESLKELPARVGEELMAKNIKVPELVQSWSKRGTEPISKMEFRQHIRKLIDGSDVKEIDCLFMDLDEDKGGTLDVSEVKASLKKLCAAAEREAAKVASVRGSMQHDQLRVDAARIALATTKEAEKVKKGLAMQKSGASVPLRERLGKKLLAQGAKIGEIAVKWGGESGGVVTKAQFSRGVCALMNINTTKPQSQKDVHDIDDLFNDLDQDGGGSLDEKELKAALQDLAAAGKSAGESTKGLKALVSRKGKEARAAQAELTKLIEEDAELAAATEERRIREAREKVEADKAAVAAKAAARAEKIAAEEAEKAAFEEKIRARRASNAGGT